MSCPNQRSLVSHLHDIMVSPGPLVGNLTTPSQPAQDYLCKYLNTNTLQQADDHVGHSEEKNLAAKMHIADVTGLGSRGRRQYNFHGERIALRLSPSPNELPAYHFSFEFAYFGLCRFNPRFEVSVILHSSPSL